MSQNPSIISETKGSVKNPTSPEAFAVGQGDNKYKYQELVDFLLRVTSIRRNNNDDFSDFGRMPVTERRRIIINEFVTNWRNNVKLPFYMVLRMILADRDKLRSYHIKEITLSSMICSIYGISKNTDEYKRLFNGELYTEANSKYSKSYKLALMMAEIISGRQVNIVGGKYSLEQIDKFLDNLDHNHSKTACEQKKLLSEMFTNMNHDEIKYVILIILKSRIIGHSENALLKAWHPDASSYFSVVSNLETLCQRLSDPTSRLNEKELSIQVMHPFAPQLASQPKKSYEHIVKMFNNNFLIEEKLDGERLQVHMERSDEKDGKFQFKFYSRRATDYSNVYGNDFSHGSIAPHFKDIIDPKRWKAIKKLVVDGEVLSYDVKRNVILPLGTLKSTNVETMFESEAFRPLFVIFDILLINNQLICDQPLFKRKSLLKQLITPKPNYIELIHSSDGTTEDDIKNSLQAAIETNSEGIIVKDKRRKYKIGERDDSWIKVKPEYLQEFGSNIDLCIIGKIPSTKTTYICGLRVGEPTRIKNNVNVFYSFCGIANGISISDYQKIESLTFGKWRNFEKDPPPSTLLQFAEKRPLEWIDPSDSVILEIKARDIEFGPYGKRYKVESTLLSGYMKSIREDKDWRSALSLEEYLSMKHRYGHGNATTKKQSSHNIEKKTKIRTCGARKPNEYMFQVEAKSDLFENYVFYILSDYRGPKKRAEIREIQEEVRTFGGKVTNNEQIYLTKHQKLVPISQRKTRKVELIHKKGYDIIHPSWIYDCIDSRSILPLEPRHCFEVSYNVGALAKLRVDQYGDSFTTDMDEKKLLMVLGSMRRPKKKLKVENLFYQELRSVKGLEERFERLFSGMEIYVVSLSDIWNPMELNASGMSQSTRENYALDYLKLKLFAKDWELNRLTLMIRENGGSILKSYSNASLIVVPNFLNEEYKTKENNHTIVNAMCEAYFNLLRGLIQKIRKTLSKKIVIEEGDVKTKIPRIVNEKFIYDSTAHDSLVSAEGKY